MKSNLLFLIVLLLAVVGSFANSAVSSKELDDLNIVPKSIKSDDASSEEIKAGGFLHHDEDQKKDAVVLDNDSYLKYDVEVLQSGDLKQETEQFEEQFRGAAALSMDTNNFSDEDIEVHMMPDPEQFSYFAFYAALAIFLALALTIFVVMMTWRRNLEQRYGARVLLVANCDDDEFATSRNFDQHLNINNRNLPLNPV